MESKGPLLHAQEPTNGPYPVQTFVSNFFEVHFNITLPSTIYT
jgi:hypothetical protein